MVIRIKPQNIMCFILAYMMNFQGISSAIMNVVAIWEVPVLHGLATPLLYASFYACIFVGVCLFGIRKMSINRVALLAFFLLSVLVTILIAPDVVQYMWTNVEDIVENPAYVFWFCSFSLFLFSDCIRDVELFRHYLEKMAYVTIGASLLYYIAALSGDEHLEYMTFSYNMLFSVVLLIILTVQQFCWKRAVVGAMGAVLVLVAGCRGALGCMLVSVFAYDLCCSSVYMKRKLMIRVVLALSAVLLLINWRILFEGIASLLESLGITSRTIEMLLEGTFFDDSGRSALQGRIFQGLNLFGHGLYGDRVALSGTYAHSVVLELLYDYGILLGSLLLVLWLGVVLMGAAKTPQNYRALICALLSVGCVKLFLSGSFMNQEPGVYLLIGLCLNGLQSEKKCLETATAMEGKRSIL